MMQTVRVPLASNTLYVSGTVNGVDKVWTREEGNWWSTTADRADDGVYRVALSIVYGDGQTASDSVTLYYGLVLITDRTEQDVTNKTAKGSYNTSDLNRVGSAMDYLRDRFNANGYHIQINPKTTWREIDVPTQSDMTLYLADVNIIRSTLAVLPGTPEVPADMVGLTYEEANDIERILLAVDDLITNMINAYLYSNEINCGEV